MTILSPEQLVADRASIVLDARTEVSYNAGHVRGAVHLDLKRWDELAKGPEGLLAQTEVWWPKIGAIGVDGSKAVAVYDDGRMTDAARHGSFSSGTVSMQKY